MDGWILSFTCVAFSLHISALYAFTSQLTTNHPTICSQINNSAIELIILLYTYNILKIYLPVNHIPYCQRTSPSTKPQYHEQVSLWMQADSE